MAISIIWWKKIELLAIETNFSIEFSKQTDKKTRDLYSYKEKFMEAICKERNYKSFNTNEYHDTLVPQLLAKAFLVMYIVGVLLFTFRSILS
jgi:hypothetical protein